MNHHVILALILFSISTPLSSQKITINPTMVTAESGNENGQKLFDEQFIAGDPKNGGGGHCDSNWVPGWNNLPHSAYINLGQSYNITDIYLYDYTGSGAFTIEQGNPGNWSTVLTDNMNTWQTWNAHPVNLNTQFLRFSTQSGECRAFEVVLYGSPAPPDLIAPNAVNDLTITAQTNNAISLSWTATGDDGNTGSATEYDLRYSTIPIVNMNDFSGATQVNNEPSPSISSTPESFTVNGLNQSTIYYFALNVFDEAGNSSGISNVVNDTTSSSGSNGSGLLPLSKTYIHQPNTDPQWNTTSIYPALELSDFDAYWQNLLSGLPSPNPNWNGGNINLGQFGIGWGDVAWNNASSSSPKPILVQLPSYGAAPSVGICPMDNRFIVCSAFNNSSGTTSGQGDYTTAILAIQQMIRNILASGNATNDVFIIGKSQGGGTGMITAGLCPNVKDFFLSVPALAGFTGSSGTNGGFPGYPSDSVHSYIDAVNHAKRYRNKATFSISYNDAVTWGRGQLSCAKNTQFTTTIYHGNDGHNDSDWWSNGSDWLDSCLVEIIDNGLGLADSGVTVGHILEKDLISPTVYPQPFNDQLQIYFNASFKGCIYLYNLNGQLIEQTSIIQASPRESLNLTNEFEHISDLNTGVYILKTEDKSGAYTQKIIKK
jgi:hypothetical protein